MSEKFVASYSGGKDSVLSIFRTINQGLKPVELITTYNIDKERSWFHGIPEPLLESVSKSINIPIRLIKTKGSDDYAKNYEKTLVESKEKGAKFVVFGDIDIQDHYDWCSKRCENVGLTPLFPLWNESRKNLVYEFIDNGFIATITVINRNLMNDKFLGEVLTREIVDLIELDGADICGENGEYHTFVNGGPIFNTPIKFSFGKKIIQDNYSILPLQTKN